MTYDRYANQIPSFENHFGLNSFQKIFESMEDNFLRSIKAATNYPPYNIKKIDDSHYVIEMALAGFDKNEIDIEMKDNTLVISAHTEKKNQDSSNYLWQGLAQRDFTRMFSVKDSVEVKNAELIDGVLKIWLENFIPEKSKSKKIPINDGTETLSKKQFLTESK